jgi:hypothetical protein
LDDTAIREPQRQEVPRRLPGGLDPQQARIPGGLEQLAILIDDEELTVTYYSVATEPELRGALQPHALDRRDC